MPLYEGIALIQEKQAVVLDIGAAYTKFGFTGEVSPRCIIPTQFTCPKTKEVKKIFNYESESDLYNQLVELLHILYFKHVLVNPKDRKVVVVESLFTHRSYRETLAKVLFCHYEVSSVLFASSPLLNAVVIGIAGGNINHSGAVLSVELGWKESTITAVVHGVPLPSLVTAYNGSAPAAKHIHDSLRNLLDEDNGVQLNLNDRVVEDIKVKTCFVTTLERAEQYYNETPPPPPPSVEYHLPGDHPNPIITISGKTRELAAECLFPRDLDNMGLGNIILDCILKCPVDTRKPLAENILITGGTAMLTGIKSRIAQELRHLITQPLYADRLFIKEFKFHTAPAKENYTAWLGGAIFGGTDAINTRSLSREAYNKEQRVKDWVNLLDNTSPDNDHWTGMTL